jgi:alginate O-acetyltransferase complex protein AlgI
MFPHLVAGPIVRYADIGPQLEWLPRRLETDRAWRGLCFFALGLSKKVLLADLIATRIVDPLFGAPATLGTAAAWLAALAYTLQLYFDFSGYSDMAVGLAHLLGLDFPQNFNSPYKAANIAEFWQRWHMSLSTWLRDYLFIPLGGSRGSKLATARNLAITMLLGGLWHGAAWTFVIWGSYHGALLGGRAWLRARWPAHTPRRVGVALTFLAVLLGWVIFRAPTAGTALMMYRAMLGLAPGVGMGAGLGGITAVGVGLVVLGGAIVFLRPNTWEMTYRPTTPAALALGLLLFACLLRLGNPSPFLYFQF